MEKEQILNKSQEVTKEVAKEVFTAVQTDSIVRIAKELTFKTIIDNPLILALLVVVLFYAVVKRSKFVLLFLFTLLSLMALVHYALPETVELMSFTTYLPFAFGCLGVGAVLIYFIFIKVE
jgi:hypothetical protein